VKRLLWGGILALVAAGVTYGAFVSQRERSYRDFVEQGDAALARDDSYAAIEAFSVAISLRGDSMAAHLKRGEAYRRRQEYESALRDLRRAAALDPVSPYPLELLGDVHYGMAASEKDHARARYLRAIENYQGAVVFDDRSARIQYKLGLASYRAGRLTEAVTALRASLELDPAFAEAHYLLGVCLRATQQHREAVRALDRAVALDDAFVAAHEELVDVYGRLGRWDDRLVHLKALAALDPGPVRERDLGLGYARADQLQRALTQLGQARQKYPEDPETFLALGRLWLARAADGSDVELRKALEALAAAVGPASSSEACTLYGRALLLSGDVVRAEQMFRQAITRFPVEPEAFLYLSDVSLRIGRRDAAQEAIIDYASLVGSDTLAVPHLLRLAEAQLASGRTEAAGRALDQVLERDPDHPAARTLRARFSRVP
jgi:tetratricopeptide (TPR) repeat protein